MRHAWLVQAGLGFGLVAVATVLPGAPADTAARVRQEYRVRYAARMKPLLLEAIRFATFDGNADAHAAQKAWLRRVAGELGLGFRDTGKVVEIDLPGPAGTPVLGLMVHGDVQKPGEGWTAPPFAGVERDGFIWGRGSADDKGPMVQALLAMAALRASGVPRTQTVRLLVGTDEESGSKDVAEYLKGNKPPDYSLVLDSEFPVVVGEKAWNEFDATAADPYAVRGATEARWAIRSLEAGVAPSIVPARATAVLRWLPPSEDGMSGATRELTPALVPEGYRYEVSAQGREVTVAVFGRAAHSGMGIERGRNALMLLARNLRQQVAASGARDLLEFAVEAGEDLYGTGLGFTASDPLWGRYAVNVATVKPEGDGLQLAVNVRSTPPLKGSELSARLMERLDAFNASHGSKLTGGGYFNEAPLVFDPESRLVKRLLAVYERSTGTRAKPAIAGGSTYAGRLPNSIAFGMWFAEEPYPGHDVDERISVRDLERGEDVLLDTLADLACSPPLERPFARK